MPLTETALAPNQLTRAEGQLVDIQSALGMALNTIGEQAGDNKALEEALAAFRAALEEYTRARRMSCQ